MTTTPADLLSAAKEVLSSHDPACDHIWNAHRQCQWCHRDRRDIYVDQLARHILATVHTDDDEPVTVEWLDAIDMPCESIGTCHRLYSFTGGLRLAAEACPGGFKPCVLWMGFGDQFREIKHPSRGQLRHLLAGLGMGGGK